MEGPAVNLETALVSFIVLTYGLRAFGMAAPKVVGRIEEWAEPLIAAVLASLVVSGGFATGETLSIDARAVGLAIAAVATVLRAPLLVTLLAATAGTAVARLFS
jgi:hypothetical protein